MSDAALVDRDKRLRWARPGSSHDRHVRAARIALPSAVGALAAVLVVAPLANRAEVSFVLKKDGVAMAPERMRVTQAQYRGQDDKGQPFVLTAGSAVQATSRVPVVRLGELSARLATDTGPSVIAAPTARYDLDTEKLLVDGPLTFEAPDGYRIATSNVSADLNTRTLSSSSPVSGQLPVGNFSAGSLSADLNARTVTLGGRARLRIVQRGGK
jgi:lipopolysaccharide export system protein LptC